MILLTIGCLIVTDHVDQEKHNERFWSLILLGALMFIPGIVELINISTVKTKITLKLRRPLKRWIFVWIWIRINLGMHCHEIINLFFIIKSPFTSLWLCLGLHIDIILIMCSSINLGSYHTYFAYKAFIGDPNWSFEEFPDF